VALFTPVLVVTVVPAAETASRWHFQKVTTATMESFAWKTNESRSATAFVFLSTDCPIANSYAPELQRIQSTYGLRGVQFWAVYCDPAETAESLRRHQEQYQLTMPWLRDPQQELAQALRVSRTPEVAVLDSRGNRIYRGRIDDRHLRLGQSRLEATTHEFRDALEASLGGRPIPVAETVAVGCHLPPLP
jgi:AhpC/TSA family